MSEISEGSEDPQLKEQSGQVDKETESTIPPTESEDDRLKGTKRRRRADTGEEATSEDPRADGTSCSANPIEVVPLWMAPPAPKGNMLLCDWTLPPV